MTDTQKSIGCLNAVPATEEELETLRASYVSPFSSKEEEIEWYYVSRAYPLREVSWTNGVENSPEYKEHATRCLKENTPIVKSGFGAPIIWYSKWVWYSLDELKERETK